MATLYVSEFADTGTTKYGNALQVAALPSITNYVITVSATASSSATFNYNTSLIRLHSDTICSVVFGLSPTATATGARMAANQTEYFTVPQGQSYKVSVVSNT